MKEADVHQPAYPLATGGEPEPQVHLVPDLHAFLAGTWRVARRLWDHRLGHRGSYEGEAVFALEGEGLAYRETGLLRLGAHEGVASRALRFEFPAPARACVLFADGRPFHVLDLSRGAWEAEHACGDDLYSGSFRALGSAVWIANWRIEGPRKAQLIESLYARR
jgi:hypothetical protein